MADSCVNLKIDGDFHFRRPDQDPYTPTRRSAREDWWQSVEVPQNVLEFFIRLFERVGVHVIDAGEEFTCGPDVPPALSSTQV